jgi:hypothetical protein
MRTTIIASAPDHSLRPITQILVGALEVALEEIFLLRGGEPGPWLDDLERQMIARVGTIDVTGVDANAAQVAESAIRATIRATSSRL